MKHLEEARKTTEYNDFIKVAGNSVVFTVQDGPINEAGINGCQAQDMLQFVRHLFKSLDNEFPCTENKVTIELLDLADHWQNKRNEDRIKRGVEGNNLA